MKDINKKAEDDELNISKSEEIGNSPKKFVPVPKVKKDKKERRVENDKR